MEQRLEHWHGVDGERRWLSLLIAAMEEAARPEIRTKPCDQAILKACRAHLMQSAAGCTRAPSMLRH